MTSHLAIVLPGRMYGPLGPALRIPVLALQEVGAEVAVTEYPSEPGRDASGWGPVFDAVNQQVGSLIRQHRPGRLTFLAKSLGTAALASLPPDLPLAARVDAMWITPLFGQAGVRSAAAARAWPSLVVAGGADSLHDPAGHQEVCRATGAVSLVLPRADHNLEVPSDVLATVEGFRLLAGTALDFVRRSTAG